MVAPSKVPRMWKAFSVFPWQGRRKGPLLPMVAQMRNQFWLPCALLNLIFLKASVEVGGDALDDRDRLLRQAAVDEGEDGDVQQIGPPSG